MKKKTALLLVAHGSKRSESNLEFKEPCKEIEIANATAFERVEYAFLEFEEQSIERAVKKMHEQSVEKLYIYPYFLNSGKHVTIDIPDIVLNLRSVYIDMEIEVLSHFGSSKSIVSIISSDLAKIL
jgi:sirohydrochlorin cobaltochelatase